MESGGITSAEQADRVFAALTEGKFWIFPHPQFKKVFTSRYNAMMKDEVVPARLPKELTKK